MRPFTPRSSLRRGGAAALVALTSAAAAIGCGNDVRGASVSIPDGVAIYGPLGRPAVESADLLLVIDNSRTMRDKQVVLNLSIASLVRSLANPPCRDPGGGAEVQPATPDDECPAGLERAHPPVNDIHIGVITSSLGGHGADACDSSEPTTVSNDDKGHLIARRADDHGVPIYGATVETYADRGYLAWDPAQQLSPPGEADLSTDSPTDPDTTALIPQLADLVLGAGQVGCGFESQLESWYRFLVDPEPYETLSVQDGHATPEGIDAVLLAQRADFLRPGSLLGIVLLSDENDCSIKEYGHFYYAAQLANPDGTKFHLPRPRSECATNPDDPCCLSCGQPKPAECPDDPSCKNPDGSLAALTDPEDPVSLRCFDQKRRFGIDFLYPIDRYVKALSDPTIQDRSGELVPNPLFSDLDPHDDLSAIRDPELVFLVGLVGVPWQDIARQDAAGAPDLRNGLDQHGNPVGGLKSAAELLLPNGSFASTWDVILGDPASHVHPADPLMIESIDPRAGTNPITGDPIAPPGSPSGANPINGHEYSIPGRNDLQYACIFPLPGGMEQDCSVPGAQGCECEPGNDNPLCEIPPGGSDATLRVRAKAYPSTRVLQALKGLGGQGVVGSICPAQLTDPDSVDFGYRPAFAGLDERVTALLGGGPSCLPMALSLGSDGRTTCAVIEARASGSVTSMRRDRRPVAIPRSWRAALRRGSGPFASWGQASR
ncbi:MAG: hypothetical protein IT372_27950 [Polyangiaceae bacterium]|nr:hypothetical protein [Polyangiaceae bacterium]